LPFVSERRRKAGVVADLLGVVGRVQPAVCDVLGIVAERVDLPECAHDLFMVVHLDNAMVVLIADQRATIAQPNGARGQRAGAPARIAVWVSIGEVFPCLLYTSPSPRDLSTSRMPSSA